MRRSKQELSQKETLAIIENSTSGTLALTGDDGYPYAVPISHAYSDGRLYFHSAIEGHKIDSIKRGVKINLMYG
jgi:nitroimidazol reductase NimA-like FMN-containing flavoprotein (pyridoxamine 5'-phosphate oxidase superfamily)